MAKRELKYERPACGVCGKLTRSLDNQSVRNRVCENGHKLVFKRK